MAEESVTPRSPARAERRHVVLAAVTLALLFLALGLWVFRSIPARVELEIENNGEVPLVLSLPAGDVAVLPGSLITFEVDEGTLLRFATAGKEGAPPWTTQFSEKRARGAGYSRSDTVAGKRVSVRVRSTP